MSEQVSEHDSDIWGIRESLAEGGEEERMRSWRGRMDVDRARGTEQNQRESGGSSILMQNLPV